MKRGNNVKKRSFYKAIFNLIQEGKSPSFISQSLNLPRQNIYYYTNNLKKWGLIGKIRKGSWRPLVKTFSLGTRHPTFTKPKTNLHALQINIPILSGKIDSNGWSKGEKLNNWTPTYKTFDVLGGITLKNNNNRSITLYLSERDISKLEDVKKLTLNTVSWANSYFRKQNIILDILNSEVKNLDIATEDKTAEEKRHKGEKFLLDLDKKSQKILPKDKIDGKAWIDGSPFQFSAETNDLDWKEAYLKMPFNMQNSTQLLHYIAQNYASHVMIVEKLNKLLTIPKVKKEIKKIDKNQTKLGDWI